MSDVDNIVGLPRGKESQGHHAAEMSQLSLFSNLSVPLCNLAASTMALLPFLVACFFFFLCLLVSLTCEKNFTLKTPRKM